MQYERSFLSSANTFGAVREPGFMIIILRSKNSVLKGLAEYGFNVCQVGHSLVAIGNEKYFIGKLSALLRY